MPPCGAMKSASFTRRRGCFDASECARGRKPQARSHRQDRTTSSNGNTSKTNAKLQELQLAFCLLSREIQGLDGGGNNAPAARTTPAVVEGKPGCAAAKKRARPDLTQPSAGIVPPAATAEGVSQQPHARSEAKKSMNGLEKFNAIPRRQDHDSPRKSSHTGPSKAHKGAARTEDRKAAEAAAAEAKEALKRLRVELDAERKSRVAAESALQQVQVKAAEATLEREKLIRVVNSFGGRSLEDLTAESQAMKCRLQEVEKALAKSQQVAAEKATEALEALEQATNLAEALETERSARTAAEEGRKHVTQKLRCCLRSRAKAEQTARETTAALRKSETQKDSLVQRLEVLRTTNKHLEKKTAAVTSSFPAGTGGKTSAGGDAGDTVARLATARARLKTLSAAGSGAAVATSTASGEGQGQLQGGEERLAIERAVGAAIAEKRWRAKIREVETRGEAYQSAARAAETGLTEAVRQRVELEEVNRILAKKLADETSEDVRGQAVNIDREENGGDSEISPVLHSSSGLDPRGGGEYAASTALPAQEENDRHACATQPRFSGVSFCLPGPPCKVPALGSAEPAEATATHLGDSSGNKRHIADLPEDHDNPMKSTMLSGGTTSKAARCSGLGETLRRQTPSPPHCRVPHVAGAGARYNNVGAGGFSTVPSTVNVHLRPRSASATIDLSRSCGGSGGSGGGGIIPPISRHQQQQRQGEAAGTVDNEASCVSSTVPFNQFLSESRQLRDEVLAAVQNGPFRREDIPKIGNRGDGVFDAGGGWRELLLGKATAKTAATSIPIEVLLRHCNRGVRGGWCEEREGSSGCAAGGKNDRAKGARAAENQNSPNAGQSEDGRSPESRAGSPVKMVEPSAAVGGTTNASLPLPPGITSSLAQQVRHAVSRGDQRGFLDIVEHCGSTARGAIAQLLSIDALEY